MNPAEVVVGEMQRQGRPATRVGLGHHPSRGAVLWRSLPSDPESGFRGVSGSGSCPGVADQGTWVTGRSRLNDLPGWVGMVGVRFLSWVLVGPGWSWGSGGTVRGNQGREGGGWQGKAQAAGSEDACRLRIPLTISKESQTHRTNMGQNHCPGGVASDWRVIVWRVT